jgi:uncharacterized membrane protein YeaQ/YmgE (transglycosylase-associated protein family)
MGLIVHLIVGGIIGWIASIVMKTNAQMGLIANVVVGIIGSGIGAYLHGMIGKSGSGGDNDVMKWVFSIAGAALLIFVLKALGLFN